MQHFMSTVKVGPKGQIVIPKEIRDMFGIAPGDQLVIMADKERGIAPQLGNVMEQMAAMIFAGGVPEGLAAESEINRLNFANAYVMSEGGVSDEDA